jgi:hypothetical protein
MERVLGGQRIYAKICNEMNLSSWVLLSIMLLTTNVFGQSPEKVFGVELSSGWINLTGQGQLGYYAAEEQSKKSGTPYAMSKIDSIHIEKQLFDIGINSAVAGFPLNSKDNLASLSPTLLLFFKDYKSIDEYTSNSSRDFDFLVKLCKVEFGDPDEEKHTDSFEYCMWSNVTYMISVNAVKEDISLGITYLAVENQE